MPGKKIGDYEIKEEPFINGLGGAVYEGLKPQTGELFLFKEINNEPGRVESFWQNGLSQSVQVPVDELKLTGQRYLVVKRPKGQPLTKCAPQLRSHVHGWSLLLQAVAQICVAVENLHANGVVHGSIHPGYIFVNMENESGDEAIASLVCFEPFTSQPTTTYLAVPELLPFFAQEQIRGAGGASSDIYALGMVLYSVLSKPSEDSHQFSPTEIAEKIVWGETEAFDPDLEILSPQLKTALQPFMPLLEGVVSGALQRLPEARFDSAAYIREHLKELSIRINPLQLTQHYLLQKEYTVAAAILEDAASSYPVRANLRLGQIYGDFLKDYENGIISFKRALKFSPDLRSARLGLIHLYMGFGRLSLAHREIMSLLEMNPNDLEILSLYAEYLNQSGNYEGALNIFRQIEDLNPYNLSIYVKAIQLNLNHDRLKEASQVCKRALERIANIKNLANLDRKQIAEIYAFHGFLLRKEGRLSRSISWFEKAVEQYPFDIKSHLNLAELYQEVGHMQKSIEHFLAAISATPGNQGMLAGMNELLNDFRAEKSED